MGTVKWHHLQVIWLAILPFSTHTDPPTLTCTNYENALQSHHTVPHARAYQSARPMGSSCYTTGWAVLEMVGRTFPFIGLPRDVIVLSVSVGPLLLSRTTACCCMTAKDGEHYPHPLAVENIKTRPAHERTPADRFHYSPGASSACTLQEGGVHLMALAAASEDVQSPSLSGKCCSVITCVWWNTAACVSAKAVFFHCYKVNAVAAMQMHLN